MRVVALLESMWGRGGNAPRAFRISPANFSGKRLYRLVGRNTDLWVTNSCREMQTHANGHGTPDAVWVADNLRLLEPFDVLLVCGRIAQRTYDISAHKTKARVFKIMHPAARTWTNVALDELAKCIRSK
jgi:hypothetical protein